MKGNVDMPVKKMWVKDIKYSKAYAEYKQSESAVQCISFCDSQQAGKSDEWVRISIRLQSGRCKGTGITQDN